MKWLIPVGVLVGLGLLVVVIFGGTYNTLVSKSQNVEAQWSQVETQYQRRYDLIPNLVETVKGFFAQEQAIFDAITEARAAYSGAQTTEAQVAASNRLESALGRLLVIVEQNPEMRSNETVARLMDELSGTENRVNVARVRYNEAVQDYNTTVQSFPVNLLASMLGYSQKSYFEAVEAAKEAPRVDFVTQ